MWCTAPACGPPCWLSHPALCRSKQGLKMSRSILSLLFTVCPPLFTLRCSVFDTLEAEQSFVVFLFYRSHLCVCVCVCVFWHACACILVFIYLCGEWVRVCELSLYVTDSLTWPPKIYRSKWDWCLTQVPRARESVVTQQLLSVHYYLANQTSVRKFCNVSLSPPLSVSITHYQWRW